MPVTFGGLRPGKYVLYGDGHFSGFRIFQDGVCQIHADHRSHTGTWTTIEQLDLSDFSRIFKVCPSGSDDITFDVTCFIDDVFGGGSDNVTSLLRSGSLSSSQRRTRSPEATPFGLHVLFDRIAWLEDLCAEFVAVLTYDPTLWHTLPSPFSSAACSKWAQQAVAARSRLAQVAATQKDKVVQTTLANMCRASKRLRCCTGMMREFHRRL